MQHSNDNDIRLIIWGVLLTLSLYLIIPSIIILLFQEGKWWGAVGLILLTIGCLVAVYTIAAFGALNRKIGKIDLLLLLFTDGTILIILGVISIFVSLLLIYIIVKLKITFMIVFIQENSSMTIIFLTFFIQLLLLIKLNKLFKESLIKKAFKIKDANMAFLKIYHSTLINKIYMIASFVITVILLGLSKDYSDKNASLKTPFFEGPYLLFLIAISIYVMNAYLVWIAPDNKPLLGIDILNEEQQDKKKEGE